MLISELRIRPQKIYGSPLGINQFREFPARRLMNKAKFYREYIRLIHKKSPYTHHPETFFFSLN